MFAFVLILRMFDSGKPMPDKNLAGGATVRLLWHLFVGNEHMDRREVAVEAVDGESSRRRLGISDQQFVTLLQI